MTDRDTVRITLRRLSRRLRAVRAINAASRFLIVGLCLALLPLLAKAILPFPAIPIAVALIVALGVAGLLYGALARIPASHVARLADHALHLKERLTCAAEHIGHGDRDGIVRAQLAETAARIRILRPRQAFPLRVMPEMRLVAPLAGLVVAAALLPAIPLRLPERVESSPPAAQDSQAGVDQPRDTSPDKNLATPMLSKELFPKVAEQDTTRGPLSSHEQQGDAAAVFRDTKMSAQRPDFGSFVKQGDDRLKMLARPEALPDLQRDFTQSPYEVMIRQMQQQLKAGNLQGLSWEQIQRLMSELGQGERGAGDNGMADDLRQDMEGSGNSTDKMASALSRALNRLRDREASAGGKSQGLRDAPAGQKGDGADQGDGGDSRDDGPAGGSRPGTERSLQTRGNPTARIGGDKQDATLEGDPREGRSEAYNTNLSGPGTRAPSRLPYLDVFARYRKLMEEALTKEPIPFSYREQVKAYFKALEPQ